MLPDSKKTVERVGVVGDVERAAQTVENPLFRLVSVDEQRYTRSGCVELVGDRVTVLAEKIEHVRPAEPKVSTGSSEMRDSTPIGPVVNGLQVDLTETGNLGCREQVLRPAGSSDHPLWVAAPIVLRQGTNGRNWKNCTLANRRRDISPGPIIEGHSRRAWQHRIVFRVFWVAGQGQEPARVTAHDARPHQGGLS